MNFLKVTSRIARCGRLLFLPFFGCSRSRPSDQNPPNKALSFLSVFLFFVFQPVHALELATDSKLATAGYFQLSWSGEAEKFELQESDSNNFASYRVIYRGKDLARVMSGKADGDYYYRLLATAENRSTASEIIKVTVTHHPLHTAILFFTAGAIVFFSTLVLIIKGNRQED